MDAEIKKIVDEIVVERDVATIKTALKAYREGELDGIGDHPSLLRLMKVWDCGKFMVADKIDRGEY